MGFFIRKSFRAGPVRLNLSKSGLGVSAGVRGARLRDRRPGRSYVHAGRHDLHYRQRIGGSSRGRGGPDAVTEVEATTDATFPVEPAAPDGQLHSDLGVGHGPPGHSVALWLIGAAVLGTATVVGVSQQDVPARFVGATGVLGGLSLLLALRNIRRRWRWSRLENAVSRALGEDSSHLARSDCARQIAASRVTKEDLSYNRPQHIPRAGPADRGGRPGGRGRAGEASVVRVHVRPGRRLRCRRPPGGFHEGLPGGRRRSGPHRRRGGQPAARARAPGHPRRRSFRHATDDRRAGGGPAHPAGQLTPIDTDQKLQRQEVCYFEAPGRLLKSAILQTFRRDGVRYKVRGLEIDKEGTLLITSKRVTLRREGTSNIPHEKIIDLEVDLDRNLLTIIKDGIQKPVYVTTPNALRAGAILAQLAEV